MDYQENAITIFKNEEFLLMLAAAGAEEWYGIDLSEEKAALESDRSFNAGLASLYGKQVVEWNGGRARITDPYRQLFRTLRDAKVCIILSSAARPDHVKACYCSGGMAAEVERRSFSEDELEVSLRSASEWLGDISGSGMLPEAAEEGGGADIGGHNAELRCSFELRRVSDGALLESMSVYERGLYAETRFGGGMSGTENYSMDRILEVLRGWIGGAE